MSWNSTFVAIKYDFSNGLNQLQENLNIDLSQPLRTVSWEEATSTSISGKSVGFCNGWTIVCDPFLFLDTDNPESYNPERMWLPRFEKGLETCSIGTEVLGFILGGVSGTYGLTIYENGNLSRCRLIQEGVTIIDFGEPSSEEREVFSMEADDEQRVFLLMNKFGLSSEILNNTEFTLYQSLSF